MKINQGNILTNLKLSQITTLAIIASMIIGPSYILISDLLVIDRFVAVYLTPIGFVKRRFCETAWTKAGRFWQYFWC